MIKKLGKKEPGWIQFKSKVIRNLLSMRSRHNLKDISAKQLQKEGRR